MPAHRRSSSVGIFGRRLRRELARGSPRSPRGRSRPGASDHRTALDTERLPDVAQDRVSAGVDDRAVELDIGEHLLVPISYCGSLAPSRSRCRSQLLDVAVEPNGSEPYGDLLDRRPDGEDLGHLGAGDGPHARSAKRLRLDEPENLQFAQRLPHRNLARLELPAPVGSRQGVRRARSRRPGCAPESSP